MAASTLVDDLIARRYRNFTVLDIVHVRLKSVNLTPITNFASAAALVRTPCPSFIAGLNFQCLIASMASSSSPYPKGLPNLKSYAVPSGLMRKSTWMFALVTRSRFAAREQTGSVL